ncbi:S-methyl-5'-thioadenosine phosphorylase [Rhizocola hellebori]|uniref:Purine nucleoside phosphorylase n=1 Tax=Rhizocola hellebori TaxID=1392758 RepID=A0A8J3VFD4_9ACTN|nr:S-methyl-5'-thioadenosine phosphorylase [Rhizocola hellebori]GIH05259.1 S-methyl-5'-thioadenosine phosphorylase [Rhizocola hellebori]
MQAQIGIIGGSGLYELFGDSASEHKLTTPYGDPSGVVTIAPVAGRSVAFLPRHGSGHRYPAHVIPYRANMWALRSLGCRQILAPCAVGGLQPQLGAGTFVVPDQLVDRTSGREHTFYDTGAVHINFADPYCPHLRQSILDTAASAGQPVVDGGTMVVINGPRFSTRAESRGFAAAGAGVINMTGAPEAALARELAMCYATIALVTDLDAGVDGERGVTQDEVFRVFADNTAKMRTLLLAGIAAVDTARPCACANALDGMTLPFELP